ncbi:hypothetical protein [Shewanella xiamenensis]|uniref:hypothetical protein n=1 Tax=Shewanella xiamenensis TaxID=332186 RepID=UPI0035BB04A3
MNKNVEITLLINDLLITSKHLRLGEEAQGAKHLRMCLDKLETVISTDMEKSRIASLLPQMLSAHERSDWLSLADYLEFEIPDMLTNIS